MKKLEKSWYKGHKKLPYTRLYLEDLEEIIRLMEEHELSVKFKTKEYEYDSLDEIKNHIGEKAKFLEIIGSKKNEYGLVMSRSSLEIDENRITIHASQDCELLEYKICELIKHKVPWYFPLIRPFTWGILLVFIVWIPIQFDEEIKSILNPRWLSIPTVIFSILWIFSFGYTEITNGTILKKRHESKGFLKAYKDKIFLVLITIILTKTADWLLQ